MLAALTIIVCALVIAALAVNFLQAWDEAHAQEDEDPWL